MYFLRDSFCLSTVSLSRQRHDNLDFAYCPLSRDNPQTFGSEFHLRSLPCAFYRRSVKQPVALLLSVATPCWRDPTRSKQLFTVAILGFPFGLYRSCRCPVSFLYSNHPRRLIPLPTSFLLLISFPHSPSTPFLTWLWLAHCRIQRFWDILGSAR